jgi:AAA domain
MTEDRSISFLIYGASKSGKSTLAVSSPAPRLYMDVEAAARFLPIKRVAWNPAKEEPPEYDGTWDTAVVPTKNWDTVQKAYQWLASGKHPFNSFIIDSISELQQRYIEGISGRSQLQLQQWGDAFREVAGLIRDIRDLTVHPTKPVQCVVLTAMARNRDGLWSPFVQGQLQDVMPYFLDLTGYLYVELEPGEGDMLVEKRRLLTRRTTQFEAGQRLGGAIPPIVESPNLEEMIETVFPSEKMGAAMVHEEEGSA